MKQKYLSKQSEVGYDVLRYFCVKYIDDVAKISRFAGISRLLYFKESLMLGRVLYSFGTFCSALHAFDSHSIFNIQQ